MRHLSKKKKNLTATKLLNGNVYIHCGRQKNNSIQSLIFDVIVNIMVAFSFQGELFILFSSSFQSLFSGIQSKNSL